MKRNPLKILQKIIRTFHIWLQNVCQWCDISFVKTENVNFHSLFFHRLEALSKKKKSIATEFVNSWFKVSRLCFNADEKNIEPERQRIFRRILLCSDLELFVMWNMFGISLVFRINWILSSGSTRSKICTLSLSLFLSQCLQF